MATQQYPQRESHFAHKAVRKMVKCCLANEIGETACWLLTVIAHTEDAAHYRRPVTFYDGQLLPLMGLKNWNTLDRARKAAVKSGWLHFRRLGNRKAGEYWVTVPEHLANIDDNPTDEGSYKMERETGAKRNRNGARNGSETQPKWSANGARSVDETERERRAINPVPIPDPIQSINQSSEKRQFVLSQIQAEHLSQTDRLAEWHRIAAEAGLTTPNDAGLLQVVASAICALEQGKKSPGGFFRTMFKKQEFRITAAHKRKAMAMIEKYRSSHAAN